ncbi:hypothetical protein BST61_g4483 [Cercospora zeina]
MLTILPILLAFLAICTNPIHAAPRKLSEVFDVNMAKFDFSNTNLNRGFWHGSCLRPFNNPQFSDNTKPLFDPAADFNSRDNILNNIWYQIYQMTYQARVALGNTNLKTYPEAQNSYAKRTDWNEVESYTGSIQEAPRSFRTSATSIANEMEEKLSTLRQMSRTISRIGKRSMVGILRTGGTCGSTSGLTKDTSSYQENINPPEAPNKPWPWALDKNTGEPSYCAQGTEKRTERMGAVFVPIEAYDASSDSDSSDEDEDDGAEAWTRSNHIVLRPQSFNIGRPDDFLEPEDDDATLDDMEITALTLYHELWHHLYPGRWAPDYKAMPAGRGADNKISPLWPALKAGYKTDYEHDISGALESMQLAQYERASPETLNINEFKTWRCPECNAWLDERTI